MKENRVLGRVHSRESFGAVDGPGVRYVVFLQGCPLRCKYCHNPDTWNPKTGEEVWSDELVEEIASYRNYIKNGGVTLSGGEPLMQADFCEDVLRRCQDEGFHTAIDTSGCFPVEKIAGVLNYTDLVLLDIKDVDAQDAKILSGATNAHAFALLDTCEKEGKDVWIRHVVIPGYTLNKDKIRRLAKKLSPYTCIKKFELLPFHKMGEYKWETMGYTYGLADTLEPSAEETEALRKILRENGLPL